MVFLELSSGVPQRHGGGSVPKLRSCERGGGPTEPLLPASSPTLEARSGTPGIALICQFPSFS